MLLAPEKELNLLSTLISSEAWDLLVGMLSEEPCLRITIEEILEHKWFHDIIEYNQLDE